MAQTIKLRRGGLGKLATTAAATLTTAQGELLLGTGSLASGQLTGPVLFAATDANTLQPTVGRIPVVTDGPALAAEINSSGDENFAGLTIHSGSKFYRYVDSSQNFQPLDVNAGALDLEDAFLNVSVNSLVFISSSGGQTFTRRESVADFVDSIAGPGLTANAGVLSTGEGVVSASAGSPGSNNQIAYFDGGANAIQGNANLTFDDTNMTIANDGKIYFRDSANYIHSLASNTLTTVAATKIQHISPTVEIGNIGDSTATTVDIGNQDYSATVNIKGDLNVLGNITYVSSETVQIDDNIIELNSNSDNISAGTAGLNILTGAATASLLYDVTNDWWETGNDSTYKRLVSYDDPTGASALSFAYLNAAGDIVDIDVATGPATAGTLLQWDGAAFEASAIIDGGTF